VTAKTKIEPLCFSNGQVGYIALIRESAYSAFEIWSKTIEEKNELLKSKFGNRKGSDVRAFFK